MEERLLREIATDYLVPFFSGAELRKEASKSSSSDRTVVLLDQQSIAFKVRKWDQYQLVLTRRQPFIDDVATVVPEVDVVRSFVEIVSAMDKALTTPLKHDLLSTFQRRIVARALGSAERESTLLTGIDLFAAWANRLYEGSPISASIGFRRWHQSKDSVQLSDFGKNDFGAVISNGHDTLLEFDFDGKFIKHVCLHPVYNPPSFCPFRQGPIADWTIHGKDKERRRVAFTLNRLGEILAFRDEQLLFARRSNRWSFLTHRPVLTQMGTSFDRNIRRPVYETCLDASFARTGACIGIVGRSESPEWRRVVVDSQNHLGSGRSVKAMALTAMIRGRKFQDLDRRLRQELVAVDGAVVLSHDGELLTVGAILKIPGGSTGGGRLAAAKELGNLGLGIKVSQDGGITGFRKGHEDPAFRLM
jgi:hypothetical protein